MKLVALIFVILKLGLFGITQELYGQEPPPPDPIMAPSLYSPLNNSTRVEVWPLMAWERIEGAHTYELQISESNDFSDVLISETGYDGILYRVTSFLTPNTRYYWRVRGIDELENSGLWSLPSSFTTRNTGTVLGWKTYSDGQVETPSGLTNVASIHSNYSFYSALNYDGTLVAWNYQDNDEDDALILNEMELPAEISNVVSVSVGSQSIMAILSDNSVVTWGNNCGGALSVPPDLDDAVAVSLGSCSSLILRADGTVIQLGVDSSSLPDNLNSIIAISAGSHNLALGSNGKVVGWGYNEEGQLNFPEDMDEVIAIGTGDDYSLVLKADGTLVSAGLGSILTNNVASLSDIVSISVGIGHSLALKSDGTLVRVFNPDIEFPFFFDDVYDMSVSEGFGLLLVPYYDFGLNFTLHDTPEATIPFDLSVTISEDSSFEELYGISFKVNIDHPDAVVVSGGPSAGEIWGNNYLDIYVLLEDGKVLDVGITKTDGQAANASGNLLNLSIIASTSGTLSLSITDIVAQDRFGNNLSVFSKSISMEVGLGGLPANVVLISPYDADILTEIWPLFSWKPAENAIIYELQVSDNPHFTSTVISEVVENGNLFRTQDALEPDQTYYWRVIGFNGDGIEGTWSEVNEFRTRNVGFVTGWGSSWEGVLNFPEDLYDVVEIAAGGHHNIVLLEDGTIIGWGNNNVGQVNIPENLSEVVSISSGYNHSLALLRDGTVLGWGANQNNQINIPEGLDSVVSIASGAFHNLALLKDGSVVGWGMNNSGQINVPENLSDVVSITAGYGHSLALISDGTVVAWGYNEDDDGTFSGQATVPAGLSNVRQIAAGLYSTVVLKQDGTLDGFGSSNYGLLNFPSLTQKVVSISSFWGHTLALLEDGTVKSWGNYEYDSEFVVPQDLSNIVSVSAGLEHSLAIISEPEPVQVFPGDTNRDGIVNTVDILNIGLYHAQTGRNNNNPGVTWANVEGYTRRVWDPTSKGGLLPHVDANGDGIINFEDVFAISTNYGKRVDNPEDFNFITTFGKELNSDEIQSDSIFVLAELFENQLIFRFDSEVSVYGIYLNIRFPDQVESVAYVRKSTEIGEGVFELDRFSDNTLDFAVSRFNHTLYVGDGVIARFRLNIENPELDLGSLTINRAVAYLETGKSIPLYFDLPVAPVSTPNDFSDQLPSQTTLRPNYPNPFNPTTVIEYQLASNSNVRLDVFDPLGRRVTTLVNSQVLAGTHSLTFDASRLTSGVYILVMTATDENTGDTKKYIQKMMLLK